MELTKVDKAQIALAQAARAYGAAWLSTKITLVRSARHRLQRAARALVAAEKGRTR